MGSIFGGGRVATPPPPPAPLPLPPIPTEVSPEVIRAKQNRRNQARAGATRNILTSPQGLPSLTEGTKKTLLGA